MIMIELESPNYSTRGNEPVLTRKTAIVLHDTGGKDEQGACSWLINPDSQVSSHFVIGKSGNVYRLVPEEYVAWHAGKSILMGEEDVNKFSIGIEIVDDSDADPYPDPQIDALLQLCTDLVVRYHIPLNRVVGHEHIAVPKGRKVDPGRDFPWYEFLNTLGAKVAEKEMGDNAD